MIILKSVDKIFNKMPFRRRPESIIMVVFNSARMERKSAMGSSSGENAKHPCLSINYELNFLNWLGRNLPIDSVVFQYGAHGATFWLAERVKELYVVENDEARFNAVEEEIYNRYLDNVNLFHVPYDDSGRESTAFGDPLVYACGMGEYKHKIFKNYVRKIDEYEDKSFDFVLAGGRARPSCLLHAGPKVKIGGSVVLLDASVKHYFPIHEFMEGPMFEFNRIQGRRRRLTTSTWKRVE